MSYLPPRSLLSILKLLRDARYAVCRSYWSGYWPGKAARAITPAEHVRRIKPTQRCWCGLNKKYDECHRNRDLLLAKTSMVNQSR